MTSSLITTSQFDARITRINPYKLLMLLYRPESSTPLTFPRAMRLAQQYQQTVMPYHVMTIAITMPNAEARSDASPKQPHKLGQRPASSVQEENKTSIESKQKVHPRSLLQTPHCMPITHIPPYPYAANCPIQVMPRDCFILLLRQEREEKQVQPRPMGSS